MTGCNRLINWKECGSKGSCPNLKHYPATTYETNLTCTGIFKQQMHKISSYTF
jgi:hypothetical protein